MDGHIAKPVQVHTLARVVSDHAARAGFRPGHRKAG